MSFVDSLKTALAKVGRAAGLQPLAKIAVEGEKATVDKIASLARQFGISETEVQKGLKLKRAIDRKVFLLALLYPVIPNAELIRAIAEDEPPAAKKLRAGPARKGRSAPSPALRKRPVRTDRR